MAGARKARGLKYRAALAGIGVGAFVLTLLLSQTGFFQLLHLKARDLHFLLRGPLPVDQVMLVVIDQKSLDAYKDMPLLFWHPYYADAIRGAAEGGAKALGLDVTFAVPVERWAADLDSNLAAAVIENAARMPVICPYIQGTLGSEAAASIPINMFAASMGTAALANLTVDRDDFVRQTVLAEAPGPADGPAALRGLALRIAEAYTGLAATQKDGQVYLGGNLIPASSPRTLTINFLGPPGTVPRVSISDFVAAYRAKNFTQLKKWVEGRAVLLGMDHVDDRHATPYYALTSGSRANTAGVEIQASAVETILDRQFLVDVPMWLRLSALLFAALFAALCAGTLEGKRLGACVALGTAATIAITHAAFRSGWLFSDSETLIAATASGSLVLFYRSIFAERRGSLFQRAVAVFVGGQVADTLDTSGKIARSGDREQVTILFSDIRGFTAFCESKDPAVVVDLLNEYMETMVTIIVGHGGHVNKFIGDGIMAIFCDHDAGAKPNDHGTRAVRCAVDMVKAPQKFKTGTGIHSGVVVVGIVGSADKMEYTALGDTVNLASRLESLNKEHKTALLMSEETHKLLPQDLETVCLGDVQVRGKTEPMKIYTAAELRVPSVKSEAVKEV